MAALSVPAPGATLARMSDDDERISLAGVDPVEALRALLNVDPDAKPVSDEDEQRKPIGTKDQHQPDA